MVNFDKGAGLVVTVNLAVVNLNSRRGQKTASRRQRKLSFQRFQHCWPVFAPHTRES